MSEKKEINFQELESKLPSDLKTAIYSADSSTAIENISKKYGLHIDQMGKLAEETGLVMLGVTHPKDFISNLAGRLGVDQLTAKSIARDVNEQIFKKVRESLMKIHGLAETPAETPKTEKPEVKVEIKVEPKPLEIRPNPPAGGPPAPPASLPVEPPAPVALIPPEEKPGMTFPEKSHESIFRTPSEVHEMDGKKLGAESEIKNGGITELVEAVKKDKEQERPQGKFDPYRESVE